MTLALGAGACTKDVKPEKSAPTSGSAADPEPVPDLPVSWEARGPKSPGAVHEAAGLLIVGGDGMVVALDPATGDETWRADLARHCASAVAPEDPDRVIVVHGPFSTNGACRNVSAFDAETGEELWQAKLPRTISEDADALTVGDEAATVITTCCYSTALRFDLETGRRLGTVVPNDTGWGGFLAAESDGILATTVLDHNDNSRLSLIDPDTGEVVWKRTVKELNEENVAGSLISTDPLIALTSELGHPMLWTLDPDTGEQVTPLGVQYVDYDAPKFTRGFVTDDLAVVRAQSNMGIWGASPYSAHALETGETLWDGFPNSGTLVDFEPGQDPDDSEGASMYAIHTGMAEFQHVLVRHDVRDPEQFTILGAVPSPEFRGLQTVSEGHLVLVGDRSVTAIELPDEGLDLDLAVPTKTAEELNQEAIIAEDAWAEDDIRPDQITTCKPSTEVLESLGFHRLDIERAGCRAYERQEPFGLTRSLEVRYMVGTPRMHDDTTPTEQAQAYIKERIKDRPDIAGPSNAAWVEVDGVGDEAYVATLSGAGGWTVTHLLVRVRNVVVDVEARGEAETTPGAGVSTASSPYEDAAIALAQELFTQADIDLDFPEEAASTDPLARAKPICGPLDGAVRAVFPDGKRFDLAPEINPGDRVAGCYWGVGDGATVRDNGEPIYSRFARIVAHAVPGSRLAGRSGTDLAKHDMKQIRRGSSHYEKPRALPGLGDEAIRIPGVANFARATVFVRIDNLLVEVTVVDQVELGDLDARAERLAREVAAAYS